MRTKAYPPFLVACAVLSAPASASADTFTLSGVTYSGGTLTGSFDFSAGVFSNFNIVATGGSPDGAVFNTNNGSTASVIRATNNANSAEFLQLTLFAILPTSPDPVISPSLVTLGCINCFAEFPASGSVVAANAINAVPLPGALSLFASGLGALGLLGWRRKRKTQAAI
jgi:PEP-CTERM motif